MIEVLAKISSILYFIIKIYTVKDVSCWKKNHRVDSFTIQNNYHKISKYSYSFSIKHEHAHKVVVKNGGCITSHNKRGEQAFYTKYTGK
jgi:hypothetical protein